jgi:hypothetical protein
MWQGFNVLVRNNPTPPPPAPTKATFAGLADTATTLGIAAGSFAGLCIVGLIGIATVKLRSRSNREASYSLIESP